MPSPADVGARQLRCASGHQHWVIPQTDANTCGAKALRMALIEMGLGEDTYTADMLMRQMGMSRGGWKGGTLVSAVMLFASDYKLEAISGGQAFGAAVRNVDDLSALPIIAYCQATKNGAQQPGGHWLTIVRRNKKKLSCDTFCVLDSASGAAHCVAISKAGTGRFGFIAGADRWEVILQKGYKFVKA
jgi:hypothetical protein